MPICENCRASVPKLGETSDGKRVCCANCVYNPLGCRCKYGELGVAEEMILAETDDYPGDDRESFDPDDDVDALEEALADCGRMRSGYCGLAGSEYCDFMCPFRR